jgi:hypothetical protein
MSAKNSTEKHEKITKIKIEFKKVVDMDRFHNDKAPLFKARVADFRRSIFEPAKLIPPNLPAADEMIASGGRILEENVETAEEKIYREYAESKTSNWSIW